MTLIYIKYDVKVKWSRYKPDVAQTVGRGIALLIHDLGTRRRWVVSSTPRPHFTPGIDPVPIVQEVGWVPGPVWTDEKSRPHRDSIPDRPARNSVAIPSELPGTQSVMYLYEITLTPLHQQPVLFLLVPVSYLILCFNTERIPGLPKSMCYLHSL
jgi:hypothetical protein